ncbi:MAG: COX15/CtaA family protein [Nocardiaceae bacterium]|nr:COX15/CtaA family protein [Nocardiaceae bacterium]
MNTFYRVLDRLPNPTLRIQQIIAIAVIATQAGIAVTGSIVRVTASGLGCPTWPRCFPGSFTPVRVAEVPVFHQAIEFGNRMLTFVVTIAAGLIVLAVLRARRRREVLVYAWLMPGGTVVQAILGGITVRTGLLWWTVSIHLLVSMAMVWIATVMFFKISEPDDAVMQPAMPRPLRALTALTGVALACTLVAGTLVTAAGPHAGDKDIVRTVPRLQIEIVTLAHAHSQFLTWYLALLIALGFGLAAVGVSKVVWRRLWIVVGLVVAQASIGLIQYFTGVPAALVALHVAGAALCTIGTAALWCAGTERSSETVAAARTELTAVG